MPAHADDRLVEADLFRRQLFLAAAVGIVFVASIALFLWAAGGVQPGRAVVRPIYYAGHEPLLTTHVPPHPSAHWLSRAAVIGAGATLLILAFAVTHAVRVVTFTFRKGPR